MSNMKQLNEFFEEHKKKQMEIAIVRAKQQLDEGNIAIAVQVLQSVLSYLETLQDKISKFITDSDAPIMEPYYGKIIFRYKDKRFMFTLDKAFNGKSNDIIHLWCLDNDDNEIITSQVDWFISAGELEGLATKYLEVASPEINMIPIEYYIWDNFKSILDNYLANK